MWPAGLQVVAGEHRERLEVGVGPLEQELLLVQLAVDLLDPGGRLDLVGEVGDVGDEVDRLALAVAHQRDREVGPETW